MLDDITSLNRRQAVYQVLQTALSSEAHTRALNLYDQEFAGDERASLNDLCHLLLKNFPDIELSHATRLGLLKALRCPVGTPEDTADQIHTATLSTGKTVSNDDQEPSSQLSDEEQADHQEELMARYLSKYTKGIDISKI